MKKLFFLFLYVMLFLQSCGYGNKIAKEDFRTKTMIEQKFIKARLDSLCLADTLAIELSKWMDAEFVSYSTNDTIKKYVWIKQWGDGTLVKYVVTGAKEPFLVEKTETYNANRKK